MIRNKVKNRIFYIWDNGGETLDRYTILINSTGDLFGCDENAEGFAMFNHNIADQYMHTTFGYGWRRSCKVKACIAEAVANYVSNADNLGVMVRYEDIPQGAQNYILSLLKN